MKISRYLASTAAVLALGTLAACGGGGGGGGDGSAGGGGSGPLSYVGNSSPAVVSTSNAAGIAANIISSDSSTAVSISAVSPGPSAAQDGGLIHLGRQLHRIVRGSVAQPGRQNPPAPAISAIAIDETQPCESGSLRISGTLNDNGTGTVSITYSACRTGGTTATGIATMRIDAYDVGVFGATDYTVTLDRLTLSGAVAGQVSGTLHSRLDIPTRTETITQNIVVLQTDGTMTKSENLAYVDVFNDLFTPTSYIESITGRAFHSVHGWVDVTTVVPLQFGTLTQEFPDTGVLLLTGAGGAGIQVMALSPTRLSLGLDLDGNGVFERAVMLSWSDLSGPIGANLDDSDGDGMHNSWESAFGLNPDVNDAAGDLDNDGFTNFTEYHAGTLPNSPTAVLPPIPALGRVITLANNSDIVFDSITQRIYAAVGTAPGSVVPINPLTGQLGTAITVGSNPAKLALSHNGQFLYVGLHGESTVQRINMATQTVHLTIPLGSDVSFGGFFVEDMEVFPGAPESIAISRKYALSSPRHAGVAIFDGSTQRPNATPGHTGSNVIEFSASASALYGYNNETTDFGFRRMAVTASGVAVTDVHGSLITGGFGADMKFGGGFLFTTNGQMIDPVARVQVPHPDPTNSGPTFTVPVQFNLVVPDGALSRVFYLVNEGGWSIRVYDMVTRRLLGTVSVSGVSGTPGSLIRWGPKGLAFRTSDRQIHILQSPILIP